MDQFIDCSVDRRLESLVKSGHAEPEELAEAWTDLFFEFLDLTADVKTKHRFTLIMEIEYLKRKIDLVHGWVTLLSIRHTEQVANALRIIGFDVELNPDDPDIYKAELNRIKAIISSDSLQLDLKRIELKVILERQSTQEGVTREYYSKMFHRINNFRQREAVNGQTSVLDYCVALKAYESDGSKKQPKKNG